MLVLYKTSSSRQRLLFLTYGPWLIWSMIVHQTLCSWPILLLHKVLTWIWYRWSEWARTSTSFIFWLSVDVTWLILTSSYQIWWSWTYQPHWSYWSVLCRCRSYDLFLLFLFSSGALALEAFQSCPHQSSITLAWLLLPVLIYLICFRSQTPYLVSMIGLNLSPLVLQEYYWLLEVGQTCWLCLWPWILLFIWMNKVIILPCWERGIVVKHHYALYTYIVMLSSYIPFLLVL